MNKKLNLAFAITISLFLFSASANAETFFAYLNSAQEVPTNASTATGYARVFLNESAGTISYTVVFNNLSSNQQGSHIHAPAAIGANAGVVITLPPIGGTSGTITGTAAITPTQITQLRAHQGYVNIHSATFPGGEIRGQLGKKRPIDFDGDGRMDLSVLRFPNVAPPGEAPITYWNRNSTTGVQVAAWGNANTDFPAPGDYDGDGRDDLCVFRAGATAGAQSVYLIYRSSDSTAQLINFGLNGDTNVNRDFDGDGISDLAIYRRGATATEQAFWWIRRSTNPGSFQVVGFGLTGNGTTNFDSPIPGDYDGDGKFDIAVYRFGVSPANSFIIRRSSDNTVSYQQFGNFSTDWVVPGDYDGDGKYDLAIARTGATGTAPMVWWILQSSSGQTRTQSFGISSDVPTQGDYDGDARADISIYRAGATGAPSTFWVLNSLSGTASPTLWGSGGDFPVNRFDSR